MIKKNKYYIIDDRIMEDTGDVKRYDYCVQASTIDGAKEFLRQLQDARRRDPDFKF